MAGSQPPSTSVGLLARLAVPGDNEAWRGFLEGYRPCLTAWGLRLGLQPHDADEVTGQVLLSLWKAMRGFRYDPAKSFSGYLQRVVRNHAATYRERVLSRPGLTGAGDDLSRLPQPEAMADEVGGQLHADLARLEVVLAAARRRVRKPTTWEAYRLTALEGRAAPEVAAALSMSVAAVYMAKSRVGAIVAEEVDRLG